MAALVQWLASGVVGATGGSAYCYTPGTQTQTAVYSDGDATATLTQPIALDSNGRAEVYTKGRVRILVQDSDGVTVIDTDAGNSQYDTEVENSISTAFTGSTLGAIHQAALTSFGGKDWKYLIASGQTQQNIKDWMTQAWVNVKAFGALGNNSADDYTAVTAAISWAGNTTNCPYGAIVYFPAGIYRVSAAIAVPDDVTLRGAGPGLSIIRSTSATADCLSVAASATSTIKDLTVDATGSNSGSGIIAGASSNVVLDRVAVSANYDEAFYFGGSLATLLSCSLAASSGAAHCGMKVTVGSTRSVDTTFSATSGLAVELDGTGSHAFSGNCVFSGDSGVKALSTYGASSGAQSLLAIVGCVFSGSFTYHIQVLQTDSAKAVQLVEAGNVFALPTSTPLFNLVQVATGFSAGGRDSARLGTNTAAANTLTLPFNGSVFKITGATQINSITTTGWRIGSIIHLWFESNPVVDYNNGTPAAGSASILLAGAADFATGADDTLTLFYDGTYWRELARTVI